MRSHRDQTLGSVAINDQPVKAGPREGFVPERKRASWCVIETTVFGGAGGGFIFCFQLLEGSAAFDFA